MGLPYIPHAVFDFFCQNVKKHLHFCHSDHKGKLICGQLDSVACLFYVKYLFWYIAHNWNFGNFGHPSRTTI